MRPVPLADPAPRSPRRPTALLAGQPALRRLTTLLGVAAVALTGACDREVAPAGEDALGVEAANAGVDALLLEGETARRIARHPLTEARVERWFAAQEALDAQTADDPSLGAYTPRLGSTGGDAVERAVAALEERPGAATAIRDAGLSVEDFVLTGLALHQALTASGPAAPAPLRRLAARNVRFVVEHADLLARFRTQRPVYVARAEPTPDSLLYYDPFGDSLAYEAGGDAALPPDSAAADTVRARADTLPPPAVRPIPPAPVRPTPPAPDTVRTIPPPGSVGADR